MENETNDCNELAQNEGSFPNSYPVIQTIAEKHKEDLPGESGNLKHYRMPQFQISSDPEIQQSSKKGICEKTRHLWERLDDKKRQITEHRKTKLYLELLVYLIIGIYTVVAASLNFEDARVLMVIYGLAIIFLIWKYTNTALNRKRKNFIETHNNWKDKFIIRVINKLKVPVFYTSVLAVIIFSIIYWNYEQPSNLVSAAGLVSLILFSALISEHKRKINWKTAFWGFTLQFCFGVFVLRTKTGFDMFKSLGDATEDFLMFSDEGINMVFKPYDRDLPPILAIETLMIIPFFSAFISALYHIGLMQFLIGKLSWVMEWTMETSASESMSAAGNIFVGQTEAPLLVKPYLETMTMSEMHAIMTGGFSTIAGGVFAAYVSMGISPSHLISASVMSAPAALAFSKIVYPETELKKSDEPKNDLETGSDQNSSSIEEKEHISPYENLVHAIGVGAVDGMAMVLNIIANLIAFLSLVAATNYIIIYLGELINISISLYRIFQYVFYPLSFLLGADAADCLRVGELLGLKTIANEFVAYETMGEMLTNSQLSKRSEVISIYALCGFSNLGSIGVQIGGLGSIAPGRKKDLARLSISAFITGNIACFSTACIAGLLFKD